MNNLKIAEIFEQIADMLEIKGVAYKPRAYRNAARSIRSESRDLSELSEEQIKNIPGIGKAIYEKIKELNETGSLQYYEDMKKDFPLDFEALLSIEGIGPKTVKKLYEKLEIRDLDDLEKAAKNKKIRDLEGFGQKTEQKILDNIEFARKQTGRSLLGYTLPIAEELKKKLKQNKNVKRIEIAGSLRRRKPTIGDIDILVTTDKPDKVMEYFVNLDKISEVIAKGKTKSTVRLKSGLPVDIRVVKKDSFGSALMYFTGSKEHNIEMRKIAQEKGWKLSEYGVFKGEKQLAGKTEEKVFQRLGLEYIPPELRENRGELKAAKKSKLPKLINYRDIRGDLQMHTKNSDGSHTIEEMAQAAKELGHEYIAITDHVGSLKIAGGLSEEEFKEYAEKIRKLDEKIDDIKILVGMESNIDSDGKLDMPNSLMKDADIVVASIHSGFRQSKEQITKRIISAMENEHVNIIAHPTGRVLNKRKACEFDFDKIIEKSKETKTYLEINSYVDRLDLNDIMIKHAIENGAKLVINTDSHDTNHLKYIKLGIATARRGWATKKDIINTRSWKELKKLL